MNLHAIRSGLRLFRTLLVLNFTGTLLCAFDVLPSPSNPEVLFGVTWIVLLGGHRTLVIQRELRMTQLFLRAALTVQHDYDLAAIDEEAYEQFLTDSFDGSRADDDENPFNWSDV